MKELKTKRLRIVPLTTEQMKELLNQPQTDEHMQAALHEMYAGCLNHPKDWLWYTNWRIVLCSDGTCIGSIDFKGGPTNGSVEIGYGIDEPFQKQGYATEAVKAATKWAFSEKGVYFVMAETERDNQASIRVLQRNGFVAAGEGEEGPRWAIEKPRISWLTLYVGAGMSIGLIFGANVQNIGVSLPVGIVLGLAVGAALSFRDNALRENFRKMLK